MGTCKLGEFLEKQLIGEFVLSAGRGSVQAHNRYGQLPAGDMKLDSLERLKGQAFERCTDTERSQKGSRTMKAIPPFEGTIVAHNLEASFQQYMLRRPVHITMSLSLAECQCRHRGSLHECHWLSGFQNHLSSINKVLPWLNRKCCENLRASRFLNGAINSKRYLHFVLKQSVS